MLYSPSLPLRLNLGSADRHLAGFVSVDRVSPELRPASGTLFQRADLAQPWPWDDSTVDEIVAFDIIEHIANRVHFMNEMWRVLKPGARATIETPNASKGAGYFQDPTHQSPWVRNSFQYFEDGSFAHQRLAKAYGITARFRIVSLEEHEYQDAYEPVWKIHAVLEAVK